MGRGKSPVGMRLREHKPHHRCPVLKKKGAASVLTGCGGKHVNWGAWHSLAGAMLWRRRQLGQWPTHVAAGTAWLSKVLQR